MRLRLKNELPTVQVMHAYEVRPRKDHRGVDLISDALPFGRLWYEDASAAVDYDLCDRLSLALRLTKRAAFRGEGSSFHGSASGPDVITMPLALFF